jgi:hypothetical protein
VLGIRCFEHAVACAGVFVPAPERFHIHGTKLPLPERSLMRAWNRRCCSFCPTSIQYLMTIIPASTIYLSETGQSSRNFLCCFGVQKPITCSTPARFYQLRSKVTTSPAAGKYCI